MKLMRRIKRARFEFKLADFWVGVFWRHEYSSLGVKVATELWICLLPCIPFHMVIAHSTYFLVYEG